MSGNQTALIAAILLTSLWVPTGEAAGLQGTPAELVLETVAKDLEVPWSIDFTPDGRIFVTERIGRIRVIDPDGFKTQLWALLDVVHLRSTGLTGLAVDPNFATTRHIYVLGAFLDEHGRIRNQVRRLTDRNGQGRDPQVVLDSLPWGIVHGIGDLAFGPDGKMFLTVGDTGNVEKSQDRGSLIGKVLRYNQDGSIPEDNPFPGSPVYALGMRNTVGLDWHPETGHLFGAEHGPSGYPTERGRHHQDELNVILPGKNYGWSEVSGMHRDQRFVSPLAEWTPAIAPAGLAICKLKSSPWYGNIFVTALKGRQLRRVVVEPDSSRLTGWRVVRQEILFHRELGRIRAVAISPDDYLYFANTNHDGNGLKEDLTRQGDDRLFRVSLP